MYKMQDQLRIESKNLWNLQKSMGGPLIQKEKFCKKRKQRIMKEERYLAGLTEKEKKLFESCMSLLHSIGENGGLEEACEWLEKYAAQQESESKDPQDSQSD